MNIFCIKDKLLVPDQAVSLMVLMDVLSCTEKSTEIMKRKDPTVTNSINNTTLTKTFQKEWKIQIMEGKGDCLQVDEIEKTCYLNLTNLKPGNALHVLSFVLATKLAFDEAIQQSFSSLCDLLLRLVVLPVLLTLVKLSLPSKDLHSQINKRQSYNDTIKKQTKPTQPSQYKRLFLFWYTKGTNLFFISN